MTDPAIPQSARIDVGSLTLKWILERPTVTRFIKLSKSKPNRKRSFRKCHAVRVVSLLSVAKATSCLNTSYCERRLAFKNSGAVCGL